MQEPNNRYNIFILYSSRLYSDNNYKDNADLSNDR